MKLTYNNNDARVIIYAKETNIDGEQLFKSLSNEAEVIYKQRSNKHKIKAMLLKYNNLLYIVMSTDKNVTIHEYPVNQFDDALNITKHIVEITIKHFQDSRNNNQIIEA